MMRRPSWTTAAAVSSQEVSIPRSREGRESLEAGGGSAGTTGRSGAARLGLLRSGGLARLATWAPSHREDEVHRVGGQHLRTLAADPDRVFQSDSETALRIV